jgi:hypothetical protein
MQDLCLCVAAPWAPGTQSPAYHIGEEVGDGLDCPWMSLAGSTHEPKVFTVNLLEGLVERRAPGIYPRGEEGDEDLRGDLDRWPGHSAPLHHGAKQRLESFR